MVNKTIKIYLGLLLGFELAHSFVYGVYVLFLVDKGLDLLQISLVNFFFMASLFAFEIPTGAVADIFGRKISYIAGCFISALGFIIYFFSGSFLAFIVAEIILALAGSLISGAFDAWLVDSIHYHGFNGDLKKIFGQKMWVIQIAHIPGAMIGVWISLINIALPWLIGGVGLIIVSITAGLLMKEEYFINEKRKLKESLGQIRSIASDSIQYGLKNPNIFYLVVLGLTLALSVQPLNMYWSVRFEEMLGGRELIGWLWAAMVVFTLIGTSFSSLVLPKLLPQTKHALALSRIITVFGIVIAALASPFVLILLFFMIHEMGRGMTNPITEAYLHEQIPSAKRATIASFKGMAQQGGAALGLLTFGLLAKQFGIPLAWLSAGVILLATTPIAWKLKDAK